MDKELSYLYKKIGLHDSASENIFKKAKMLRNNMTKQELALWHRLNKNQLGYKFRRQHPMGKYILDFFCYELRLSLEIDGKDHNNKLKKLEDSRRTNYLQSIHIKEIRFTNDEVDRDIDSVIESIEHCINRLKLTSD